MKNVNIIYWKYLDENMKVAIGGVQTYISDLCNIIAEMGHNVRVVQFAGRDFFEELSNRVSVQGFYIREKGSERRKQILYNRTITSQAERESLTIFASELIIPHRIDKHCIAIQHGIGWDIPRQPERMWLWQLLSRNVNVERMKRNIAKIDKLVCVDYNFLNWFRCNTDMIVRKFVVVPNYTKIAPRVEKEKTKKNIIFARRLIEYRGTRIFAEAIKRILQERSDVCVTIAGTGPDEKWLKQYLSDQNNVQFIQYSSCESLSIHKNQHIAVVPTVGAEGTSLSLLEGMSSQCAVICTDVGGMTNIVLNGYNGIMVGAGDVEQLYGAISYLLNNEDIRAEIAENGYQTVRKCFNYEKWRATWLRILEEQLG